MQRLAAILRAAGVVLLLGAGAARAEERILDYESRVVVGADGVLTVTETITVQAEGRSMKHGIYRDFPTAYRDRGGAAHIVGFNVESVRRDGRPENWFTEGLSNGKRVYVGKKDVYLAPGWHTYEITYATDRQIGFFDAYDEIYWNVTGNDWKFTIDHASVTIVLPEGAEVLQKAAYTGRQGATGQDWRYRADGNGNPAFETTRPLRPGEGLTVAVGFPKGFVTPPSAVDEFWWSLRRYMAFLIAGAALAVVLAYYLFVWSWVGRDPAPGTIVPRWKPPVGVSPAAASFITEMGFGKRAIGAAIVDLAVKGKLIIQDDGDDQYTLRKHDGGFAAKLSPGEKALARALFAWGDAVAVRQGNHARLKPAVDALRDALSTDFEGAHFRRNLGWFALGVAVSILALIPLGPELAAAAVPDSAVYAVMLAIVGMFALNALFMWLLKAPTRAGRAIMDEIEGFKMYLATAEQERLNLLHPPERTPELFEKYLPYAMALDVETEWGDQFEDLFAAAAADRDQGYSPSWYVGPGGYRRWSSLGGFASSLGSSLGGAISSAATPPGSSSGSGGGGSSGGGGGGGGGGGW